MASRTVFKIFGSFGPGGSLVALTEKFCRRVFNEAYELGDPTEFRTPEEDQIKGVRQDYVNALFNIKGAFERKSTSLNPVVAETAYQELEQIILKYKGQLMKLEKSKLAKERNFYLGEENELKYKASLKKLETLEEDVVDNLTKMCHHILGTSLDRLRQISQGKGPVEDDKEVRIEERVTAAQAEKMLAAYKKMKVEAEDSTTSPDHRSEALLAQETRIKDRLFIEYGEDVDDIFAAFKHYGLNTEITDDDRKTYSNRQ